ncbi:MAG: glutamine amidotransferase-related protein [Mediterraneibacter gnavus]
MPGGFGHRGVPGKIEAIQLRPHTQNPVPRDLCLGMQLAIVEFARNVLGHRDAHSAELDPATTHPVIHIMPGSDRNRRSRRNTAPRCLSLRAGHRLPEPYKRSARKQEISERHRHRYEVNNDYREVLSASGMNVCGLFRMAGSLRWSNSRPSVVYRDSGASGLKSRLTGLIHCSKDLWKLRRHLTNTNMYRLITSDSFTETAGYQFFSLNHPSPIIQKELTAKEQSQIYCPLFPAKTLISPSIL